VYTCTCVPGQHSSVQPPVSNIAFPLILATCCDLQVSVWDLTTVSTHPSQLQPLSKTAVPTGDTQTCITFHPQDPTELVTNGSRRVLFWRQQQQAKQPMNFYSPPLKPTEFQQAVGEFVASAFVPGTSQVQQLGGVEPRPVLWGTKIGFHL
jgi:hypothetical protein